MFNSVDHTLKTTPAYILCGGRSRRFGSDKARIAVEGEPLIFRLAEQLGSWCGGVYAVADRAGKYADLNLVTLSDQIPEAGPLGGLQAALSHAEERAGSSAMTEADLIVISCDLTVLRKEWLLSLIAAGEREQVQASIFEDRQANRFQPFPGYYRTSLRSLVEEQIGRGELSLQGLFRALPEERLRSEPLPADWPEISQINTPQEWKAWEAKRRSERGK